MLLLPAAARSKVWVYGRLPAETAGSNRRGHGCLSVVSVVRYRSLRLADPSSRGVLPNVVRRWVWSRNLKNEEAKASVRPQSHKKKKIEQCYAVPFSLLLKLPWRLHWFPCTPDVSLTCTTVCHRFHFQQTFLCAISSSHSGVAEHSDLLRCHAVLSGKYLPMFQNITVTSLSASARPWKCGHFYQTIRWETA